MRLGEIIALIPLLAQLISLFGGNKAKKKARNIYPMILEGINLWPEVKLSLDRLVDDDPAVARFRLIVDQVVEDLR